jgi:hypothetical protein
VIRHDAADEGEGALVAGDPVGDLLGEGGLGVGVVRRAGGRRRTACSRLLEVEQFQGDAGLAALGVQDGAVRFRPAPAPGPGASAIEPSPKTSSLSTST